MDTAIILGSIPDPGTTDRISIFQPLTTSGNAPFWSLVHVAFILTVCHSAIKDITLKTISEHAVTSYVTNTEENATMST